MALKINKKAPAQPKAVTTTAQVHSGETVAESAKEEAVGLPWDNPVTAAHMCEVGFQAGYTHNLGNYNSAKVTVSLFIPCEHENINKAYAFAESWVNGRMQKCVADLTGGE